MDSVSDNVAETYECLSEAEFAQGIGQGGLFRPEPIALLDAQVGVAKRVESVDSNG